MRLLPHEAALAARLLKEASAEFSRHSCNDFELDNTDDNWELIKAMCAWNSSDPADQPTRPALNTPIYTQDSSVMAYLAHRLKQEADSAYDE